MKKIDYPKCSCGCKIDLTEINGSYICFRCRKELKKCVNIVNAMLRAERKAKY